MSGEESDFNFKFDRVVGLSISTSLDWKAGDWQTAEICVNLNEFSYPC